MTNPDAFKRSLDWKVVVTGSRKINLAPHTTVKDDLIVQLLSNHRSQYILRRIPQDKIQKDKPQYSSQNHEIGKQRWDEAGNPYYDAYARMKVKSKLAYLISQDRLRYEESIKDQGGVGSQLPQTRGVTEASLSLTRLDSGLEFEAEEISIRHCVYVSNYCFEMEPSESWDFDLLPLKYSRFIDGFVLQRMAAELT